MPGSATIWDMALPTRKPKPKAPTAPTPTDTQEPDAPTSPAATKATRPTPKMKGKAAPLRPHDHETEWL